MSISNKSDFYVHFDNDTMLVEMAEVGRFNKCKVTVYGKEGPIPHFHFYDIPTKRQGCIRIDVAEYFNHGKYNDTLSRDEIKILHMWLTSPHQSFGTYGLSNYDVICIYWDDNNPNYRMPEKPTMPNYLEINK